MCHPLTHRPWCSLCFLRIDHSSPNLPHVLCLTIRRTLYSYLPDNTARAPPIISVFPSERHGDDLQRGITIAAHDGTVLVLVKRTTHARAQGRIILRIMLTLLQPFFSCRPVPLYFSLLAKSLK